MNEEEIKAKYDKIKKKAKRWKRKYLNLKNIIEADGCVNCKYEDVSEFNLPCNDCKRAHIDYYQNKY